MHKLLIVDDSRFQRNKLLRYLGKTGRFEIEEAENGTEAVKKAISGSFDCIVLDIVMPEMDGTGVMKELNKCGIKTPIIVCTADIQTPVQEECISLGAKAFIQKPPNIDELIKLIDQNIK